MLAIFDLDQTLIDSLEKFYIVFNQSLKFFNGKTIDWNTFYENYARDTLNKFIPKNVCKEDFWNYFLENYDNFGGRSKVIDGAIEALVKLRERGFKIIVVTGRKSLPKVVERELRQLGLMKYVDKLYTAYGDRGIGKDFSKKDLLKRILRDFHTRPDNCIFVSDYTPDIVVGKELGIYTIGVLTGLMPKNILLNAGANIVIESIKDITKILNQISTIIDMNDEDETSRR